MKTLIVLIGPTGVGKTALSLRIAEALNACIVSADSRQLYADLKIGTAAPTEEQMQQATHYMVGTLKLTDYYSAAQYETEVMALLDKLFLERDNVVLTGGSMMYIDAVCKGISCAYAALTKFSEFISALVDDVVNSLSQAVEKVEEVNGMIQKTAENAVMQMESMNQIKHGVQEMSQGIQDNSAMAEETSATSEELAAQVVTLNELVGKFELN